MIWRDIPGLEGRYQASDSGEVRSLAREYLRSGPTYRDHTVKLQGKTLSPYIRKDGHVEVRIAGKTVAVHVLVAAAFHGPRPEGLEVCHNDGNPQNNVASNLRYDTMSGNMLDRVKHGTHHYAARTHCKNGHEYTPENTQTRIRNGRPARVCRECRLLDKKAQYLKRKARARL